MKELLKNNLNFIFFCCFMFIFLCFQTLTYNNIDPDFWARLIQGNSFLETGHLLKSDILSFTQTHIWLDHEWGASIIFAFVLKFFGFKGILILRTLITFLIFFFIFKTIEIRGQKQNLFLNIILFSLAAYALPTITQSGLRCHFFTFLFFTLFLCILELVRVQNRNKLLFLLPLIMLFWSNIHGGCVSGLGLIGIYCVGELFNKKPFKKYIITLAASTGVMFINPYGIEFVKFIFTASTMPRPNITEWLSPFAHPSWDFMLWFKILYVFYAVVLLFSLKNIKTDFTKNFILLVCLFVSARNVKSTPFFIITSMIFLYDCLDFIIQKMFSKVNENKQQILSVVLGIIILIAMIPQLKSGLSKSFLREQPLQAVEFLRINELKGTILTPLDYGSYAAYKLYPDILIYMDGRYEEVYYPETKILADNFYLVKDNWEKILEFSPDYIIIPADGLVNDYLDKRNDYKLIYANPKEYLYAKSDTAKEEYQRPPSNYKDFEHHAFETKIKFK